MKSIGKQAGSDMELGLRYSLDAIFERREASRRSFTPQDVADAKDARFVEAFMEKREAVVRPVLEAVGSFLMAKGLQYTIYETNDEIDPKGAPIQASIGIALIRTPQTFGLNEYPGLAAICEKRGKVVRFHARKRWPNDGGAPTSAGVVTLDELTCHLVQDKILEVVAEVFR